MQFGITLSPVGVAAVMLATTVVMLIPSGGD